MDEKIIILDTRENKEDFISYLADTATKKGYSVHLEALPFGDIRYKSIIVERKEINDFASSVCSDRMFTQIAHMKANPEYTAIIALSGTYKELWKDNVSKIPHLNGALRQIMAWGIPVIYCDNDEELVDRTLQLFEYARPIDVPIKRVDKDDKMSMFMALPGVGRKNGKILLKKYGNICELCEASQKDLQNILGPKKGETVYKALRE